MKKSISNLEKTEILFQRLTELSCQDWPDSALYVIATPIGNLADLSLRAWETLMRVDLIAVEDTRISRVLLDAWGIKTSLLIAHKHNEAKVAQIICKHLQKRSSIALISDAGTPSISDPGAKIVCLVRNSGYRIIPIPGPSAVTTALMASGATNETSSSYVFAGFIPSKNQERIKFLDFWCNLPTTIVMFETPHRLSKSLIDLIIICGEERYVTLAREMTKYFERITSLKLGEINKQLQMGSLSKKGEFVLIIHPDDKIHASRKSDQEIENLLNILLKVGSLSTRDVIQIASRLLNLPRNDLYRKVLDMK